MTLSALGWLLLLKLLVLMAKPLQTQVSLPVICRSTHLRGKRAAAAVRLLLCLQPSKCHVLSRVLLMMMMQRSSYPHHRGREPQWMWSRQGQQQLPCQSRACCRHHRQRSSSSRSSRRPLLQLQQGLMLQQIRQLLTLQLLSSQVLGLTKMGRASAGAWALARAWPA
jgi:hypothetical protein